MDKEILELILKKSDTDIFTTIWGTYIIWLTPQWNDSDEGIKIEITKEQYEWLMEKDFIKRDIRGVLE